MERRKKIVFLLEDLCFGGTQKQNLELALRLDKSRYDVTLLTLTGPTDMDEKCAGLNLLHLGKTRKPAPLFFLGLGSALKRLKPDILVPCTALPNIWGRIWGRLLSVPVIVGTCRGGGAPMRQHERFLWRLADHVVCNSLASVDAMKAAGAPEERLSFIANGLDIARFAPDPAKKSPSPLIVCVARLAGDKDHKTLLDAFGLAVRERPDLRLRLVGEGPEEAALKEYAANNLPAQAATNVEFAGASSDPLPHYQEASIFALSSVREGQPNTILEAMGCALPICATEAGGIPQIVEHGNTGLLSPCQNSQALAANLVFLANNPDKADKMGQAARENVLRGYSFAKMVDAHSSLFEKLWKNYAAKNPSV